MDVVFDYIVIGSGPGGSACARTLALKSKKVCRVALLERGGRVAFTDCLGEYSGCAILCRASGMRRVPSTSDTLCSPCLCYMGDYAGNAIGGQSAVNFGVWAAPSYRDIQKAYPPNMTTKSLVRGFLNDIDRYIANEKTFTPVPWQNKVADALTDNDLPFQNILNQSMVREDTHKTDFKRCHNGHLTSVRALRNDLGERKNAWDALVDSLPDNCPRVITIINYEVDKLVWKNNCWEAIPKPGSQVQTVKARKVFVACGALETPALLMRSFDNLTCNAGKGLMNHEQSSTVVPVKVLEPGVSEGMHPIATINVAENGRSSNETMMSSLSFSIMARLSNALTRRSIIQAVCCFCVPPHGLAWSCCYRDARMQVFRDTNPDGVVSIASDGNPRLCAPSVSAEARRAATQHYEDVLNRFKRSHIAESFITSPYKSSWHYVGSMKAPRFEKTTTRDAAVDHSTHVLDSDQKPLYNRAGIYVADASIARCVPVVNTMSIAAYSGYVSAILALKDE